MTNVSKEIVNFSLAGTGSIYVNTDNREVLKKQDQNQQDMENAFNALANEEQTLATVFHKNDEN